jgi:thiol-disulfide isomerase/thioredoxin
MDAGRLQFEDDPENLLQEKIISRDFTGDAQAYLYAVLLDVAMTERNTKNILAIFDRFRQKHPGSPYVAWFKPYMDTIREKQRSGLTDQMVFVKDNGTKLDSFSQVLALMKGKTVLLDMWGTWCGPCREELAKDGPIIKAHFKGKGLDYLYIANGDQGHEANWKHLIAYFKLDGTHILASENLDKDIMARVKGEEYPSYIIIKKDGTYTLSNAGHPTNVDELIKELEEALAN